MSTLSPGTIYLADRRGFTQTSGLQRYCTLNFDSYYDEARQQVGGLKAFNDEMLAGLQSTATTVSSNTYVVIIPVTGALNYEDTSGRKTVVDVGEVYVSHLTAQSSYTVGNPYEGDWINYLQIHIEAPKMAATYFSQLFGIDLETQPNRLATVVPLVGNMLPFALSIGRFDGRKETIYHPQPNAQLFAFALAGAFEMQGRLLHERDALALWDAADVDLEALSNNALMLIIELPAIACCLSIHTWGLPIH